jgi:repressor LexA
MFEHAKEVAMGLSERQQRIYEFITKFMREKGRPPTIREIGGYVGISSTSVVNYNLNILVREGLIAREKEVSRGLRVVGAQAKALASEVGFIQIPLLGKIAAGTPIPVPSNEGLTQFDGEMLSLTRELLPDSDGVYALEVRGNSMIDALINDGDIVVMKRAQSAMNGEMCAVWLKDKNETTLKRVYRERNNRIRLQPMNPTMKPFYAEARNVEIQGKVMLVVRQLQKRPA